MENPGVTTPTGVDAPSGIFQDGYGLEIQGHKHIRQAGGTEAVLFLPRESTYRIRVSNANDHLCMVALEIDDMQIGTLLLHAFSKCDLERPLDRPLNFVYGQPEQQQPQQQQQKASKNSTKSVTLKQIERDRTRVCATFKPETGARVIQVDVTAPGEDNTTHRLELMQETTVHDLLCELRRDFGDWVMAPNCALIHWTTAEYDSPVEDVLRSDAQTVLRNCKRRETPLRKMTLFCARTVEIKIENEAESLVLETREAPPTVGNITRAVRDRVRPLKARDDDDGGATGTGRAEEDGDVIYLLTEGGRDLCSTLWAKDQVEILHLMHKDEILQHTDNLVLRATYRPTPDLYRIYARLGRDTVYELHVGPCSTVRELRYQLEVLGGPWGEDPSWLYGGTLMESGQPLIHYGIGSKAAVDVIPRIQDKGEYRMLQMTDPIAVDGEKQINTAEMIHREDHKANKKSSSSSSKDKSQGDRRRPRRGATVLRGRCKQQFVEVNPIEVDQRFVVTFAVSILPKEHEEEILQFMQSAPPDTEKRRSSSCVLL